MSQQRIHYALVLLGWLALSGCAFPTNALMKNTTTRSAARTAPPRPRATPPAQGDSGPVYELRVNRETLSAVDLWAGEHESLASASARGVNAYQRFLNRQAAERIRDKITEMLLYQHAALLIPETAEKSIEKHVDGEIRRIITTQHEGVQRRFERALQKRGISIEQTRDRIRREIVIANFLEQEIKSKIAEPTRAELHAAFRRNIAQWRRPKKCRMSLIELRFDKHLPDRTSQATEAQREQARTATRALAQALLRRIHASERFADLARLQSDGLRASDGGDWGWVDRESVRERFLPALDALASLGEGQVSGIIETPEAIFLVRCDELTPAYEPSFAEVQVALKQKHFSNAYNTGIADLVASLRRKARIDPPDLERFHAAAVEVAMADGFLADR